jgi:hypothetical protein
VKITALQSEGAARIHELAVRCNYDCDNYDTVVQCHSVRCTQQTGCAATGKTSGRRPNRCELLYTPDPHHLKVLKIPQSDLVQ